MAARANRAAVIPPRFVMAPLGDTGGRRGVKEGKTVGGIIEDLVQPDLIAGLNGLSDRLMNSPAA